MLDFIAGIGAAGRTVTADFLVVPQNATHLIEEVSAPEDYAAVIDALAVEDTWFYGDGDAPWNADGIEDRAACAEDACDLDFGGTDNVCDDAEDAAGCREQFPVSGDLHGGERHSEGWSTEERLRLYEVYIAHGVPVFNVDYCASEDNAASVYEMAREAGLRPLVTRVSLDRLTTTPPPTD